MAAFGERVKQLRTEAGMTQEEFGKIIGVTKYAVSLYESEKSSPNDGIKLKLADYFNVSLDWLMGRTDHREAYVVPLADFAEHMPPELRDFVLSRKSHLWAEIARKADEYSLTEEDIEDLIEMGGRLKAATEKKEKSK
ncbi:MAG: helix-turn-helix domain-containing protein [bacterium]|jgi:transcriptional regulator with XRE-family HTH domain